MKKHFIYWLTFLTIIKPCFSQDCNYTQPDLGSPDIQQSLMAGNCISQNGFCHTPKGNIHVMYIVVDFNNEPPDAASSWWPENGIPNYTALNGTSNNLLDIDPNNPTNNNNLTTWYNIMSNGNFKITGEIFKATIDRIYTPITLDGVTTNYIDFGEMTEAAFANIQSQHPNRDWSNFDQRQNTPNWGYDNSQYKSNGSPAGGDGVLDFVFISFRMSNSESKTRAFGHNVAGIWGNPNLTTSFGNGKTYTVSKHTAATLCEYYEHSMLKTYFTHEFAHQLYTSSHYMGANVLAGQHLYTNKGWGMMSYLATMHTTNAWEKWLLGWIDMSSKTINTNQMGIVLKDFVTQNDALRIAIPNTSPQQYLWLENHQKLHVLDDKLFYKTESPMGAGIYAFISSNGSDCNNTETFKFSLPTTNMFKVLSKKGNYDHTYTSSQYNLPSFQKISENPISGENPLAAVRKDFNNNNSIEYCRSSNEHSSECYDDQANFQVENGVLTEAFSGSAGDVFTTGDEISINGIVPALNYPTFNTTTNQLNDFLLNGLKVKIVSYNATTGEYTIDVSYNEHELKQDKRWTSFVSLPNVTNNTDADLIIKNSKALTLNKSGTVNTITNTTYVDFIKPTIFTCKEDAYIKLENNSTILLDENSTMQMDDNSKIELFPGAQLIINDGSTLRLKNLSQLIVHTGAKVVIQQGGKLTYEQGALITLGQDAYIELQQNAQIEIGANATFTWSGLGYIKVNTPTFGVSNIIASGANAKFYKAGALNPNTSAHDYKHIEVVNGSLSVDKTLAEFKLINCKILLGLGAIVDVDPACFFGGVKFTTDNPSIKHGGLWVYGQQDLSYANSCTFEYAYTGVTVYPAKGVSPYFRMNSSTFRNCDYGIAINGKGAIINNCKFWSMGIQAIRLNGIQHESRIVNSTLNDCAMGVFSLGSSTNLVRVVNSNIYQNTSGVYARNATIAPGCSYVNYNYLGNLMSYQLSNIIIDPITLPHVGYNKLSSNIFNTPSIYLNNSSGVSLNKGHTNFSSISGSDLAIQGQIVPNFVPTIPPVFGSTVSVYAEQNYWHTPGTMPTASPVQLLSYDVDWQDGFGRKILLDDNSGNSFTSPPSIGNCNPAPPPGSVTFPGDKPGEFLGKAPKQLCDNTDLEVVFMQATDLLYPIVFDVPPQCLLAFTMFENIAGCPFDVLTYTVDVNGNLVNEFELWHNVLDLSYTRLVESMIQAVAHGELNITDPNYLTYLTRVQIVQGNLLNMSGNYHQMQYRFYTDLAMLYRLGKHYDDALTYISLAASLNNSIEEIELNNYYQCTVTKEKMMEADELSKEDYLSSIEECYAMLNIPMHEAPAPVSDPPADEEYDPESENRHTALPKTETNINKATTTVYPNPSNGVFYIKTNETVLQISVVDMQGKTIATYNNNQPIHITQKGIYTVVITTINNTVTRKVMVK